MAGYYKDKNNILSWLLIVNGMVSIIGPFITIADVLWVMTTAGITAYFLWNVLMIFILVVMVRDARNA